MTWLERLRACETPEEMAVLLDDGIQRSFCPHLDGCSASDLKCNRCIVEWLEEAAPCQNGN